jgi:glycosyltransferase involved in cell wall biosynthesis
VDDGAPLVSVLLPTRNRLEFLRYAIETVRRQDDGEWELVVSDNHSEDDVAGYVLGMEDERIRYVHTPSFVPVTENWNNALAHSTGRYVVMLGDDDGLMPGYVGRIRELTRRFDEPDLIYQSAWLYTYPGVDPGEPAGYLQPYGYSEFLRGVRDPFVLDWTVARRMVDQAMHFRLRYGFNMQFSTVSRRLVEELEPQGPFYQSAFPDYYATNVAFLTARRIVVEPRPLVTIGVTPKSYGFFHLNDQEATGKAFLDALGDETTQNRLRTAEMPGTNINAGWLSALESISARYGDLVPTKPDYGRFRFLQAVSVYTGHYLGGAVTAAQVSAMERHLSLWERALGRSAMRVAALSARLLPERLRGLLFATCHRLVVRQFVAWNPPKLRGTYATVLDIFEDPPRAPPPARGDLLQRLSKTAV